MAISFILKQHSLQKLWLHDSDLSTSVVENILEQLTISHDKYGLVSLFLGKCEFRSMTSKLLAEYIDFNQSLEFLKTTNTGANGAKSNIIIEVTAKQVVIRDRASSKILVTR